MPFHIVPPSDQVAAHLREQLLTTRWANELPGTPALAAELGIDRKTVIAALNLLEEEGLLKSQGAGRPRRITVHKKKKSNALKICIIPFDQEVQELPYTLHLVHRLKEKGHNASISGKTLLGLNMDITKIARYIENEPADLWMPIGASLPVLKWFIDQDIPAFSFFGRRRKLKMGSIGPDKVSAVIQATRKLIELGHRRISYFAREERRKPKPGYLESIFLKELEAHGIVPSPYNMPDWEESAAGFNDTLDKLFKHTPPTALIFDEAHFLIAATHRLAQSGLSVPKDVSMLCMDHFSSFDWCLPRISHISWDTEPLVAQTVEWCEQYSHGKHKREPIFTPAKFVEGETIGPAKR
jgi:DNA-binding transcriptional regulator YhcF (GntR family)